MEYELLLKTEGEEGGKIVVWQGKDGLDAARRYVDAHRGATVVAWRGSRTGLFVLGRCWIS